MIEATYTDPDEGGMELQLWKFGLFPLRPIEDGERLRWHVGREDIQSVTSLR